MDDVAVVTTVVKYSPRVPTHWPQFCRFPYRICQYKPRKKSQITYSDGGRRYRSWPWFGFGMASFFAYPVLECYPNQSAPVPVEGHASFCWTWMGLEARCESAMGWNNVRHATNINNATNAGNANWNQLVNLAFSPRRMCWRGERGRGTTAIPPALPWKCFRGKLDSTLCVDAAVAVVVVVVCK